MSGPYYADDHVTLYLGDFREILPQLDGAIFDAICTDPPYGETSLDWDVWPKGWPSIVAPFARSMWCFGSMRMFLEQRDEFADWRLSQDIVWEKHNGSGFATDRFRRVHEFATHWFQGAWADVRHEAPSTPTSAARRHRRRSLMPAQYGARGESVYAREDGGPQIMRSVQYVRSMHGTAINETEKPTGILEPLIAYAVPPGGLVLDIFAGSGSTAAAARAIGRRAVLIEQRESQCEKAADRLSQGVLDLPGSGT